MGAVLPRPPGVALARRLAEGAHAGPVLAAAAARPGEVGVAGLLHGGAAGFRVPEVEMNGIKLRMRCYN